MGSAIPAQIRLRLGVATVLLVAVSGIAVAHGQESGLVLAYVAVMLFVLAALVGRLEWVLALGLALSVVAVGPFSTAADGGAFHTSSMRLPLLVVASAAVLLSHRGSRLPGDAVLLFSALLLFLIVGLPFSPDPSGGAEYLLKLCVPLAVAGAIASLGSYGVRFAETLGLGALGATMLVDYGMLAVGEGYYADAGTELLRFGGLAASGPSTGFVLSILGVFALVVWLTTNRLLALLLWLASFPLLLATFTRSAIAAWLIGGVVALLLAKRLQLTAIFTIVVTAVLVGNTTLANRSIPDEGGGWSAVIASVREDGVTGISSTGRTELWSEMTERFTAHPFTGNGLGAAEYYTKRFTSNEIGFTSSVIEQAHSEYLTLLVGGGLVAMLLWLMTWIVLARSVWRGTGRLAVSCIVVYGVLAAVDSPIENYSQGGALIGIALGWALAKKAPRDEDGDRFQPRIRQDT